MKSILVASIIAVFAALLWGSTIDAHPQEPRPRTVASPPTADWYATLPADPEVATTAYLRRVPPDVRARGDAYQGTRYVALALRVTTLVASVGLYMFSGASARMRDIAGRRLTQAWLQDAICAVAFLAAVFLLGLPVETYADYVRPHLAGFSRQGYIDWLSETAMSWAVTTPFYVIGISLAMALIRRRPHSWVAWATAMYLVLSCIYVLLSPQYIEPLFNRITPLAEGPVKHAILSLARANGVPAKDVYVRDASQQSELLNAHVSGFGGRAQIVLDDNTISKTPMPEVEVVMAHELGHYVLAHIPKAIAFDSLVTGVGFLLVGWSARRLLAKYGLGWKVDKFGDAASIPVLWGLVLLWNFVSLPIGNTISREQEAEADIFGINASGQPLGLAEFLIHDADGAKLDPSSTEEWLFYDHPSVRNRVLMAMTWRAEHIATTKP